MKMMLETTKENTQVQESKEKKGTNRKKELFNSWKGMEKTKLNNHRL